MTGFTQLFEDLSLRINIKTGLKKIKDLTELSKDSVIINSISWNIQENDDECDFFEVPEEKLNLIAYRHTSITFADLKADFQKTFSATKKTPTFFTLRDIINCIIEFEKEARQLFARRGTQGEIDTQNNVFQGLNSIEEDNNHLKFSLNWGN